MGAGLARDGVCTFDTDVAGGRLLLPQGKFIVGGGDVENPNPRQHKGEPKLPFNLSLRVLFFYY